jgi:hypothetical protein
MSKKPYIKFPYKKIKGTLNWYDANSKTGWIDSKEFKELTPSICHTQGWIFEETKTYIKTFSTYSIDPEDNSIDFGEILCIPKVWLKLR